MLASHHTVKEGGVAMVRCAVHPEVETGLTCSRCGTPICPRCLVQTPVGARCRSCARVNRLPTFRAGTGHYLLASVVGIGTAAALGLAWLYAGSLLPIPFLPLVLALGAGYLIGQAVSLSVNRKRGVAFQVIAGASTFLSYSLVSLWAPWLTFGQSLYGLLILGVGIYLAIMPFR
ncbi:MAG: hypothetical protein HYX99_03240 [Chloroflexi bacterium]|nr:hypothetical protein [Chloroflexota bacterium]